MKRDGKDHHGGACQMAFRPLGLVDAPVQMRDDVIEQQQKQDACPEAEESREKGELSHGARLFDGGDDQAPDGGRHHHARRKAGQSPLHAALQVLFQEEYAGSPGRCADKGDQKSYDKCFHFRPKNSCKQR